MQVYKIFIYKLTVIPIQRCITLSTTYDGMTVQWILLSLTHSNVINVYSIYIIYFQRAHHRCVSVRQRERVRGGERASKRRRERKSLHRPFTPLNISVNIIFRSFTLRTCATRLFHFFLFFSLSHTISTMCKSII